MCKFILLKTDFSIPLTDSDYKSIEFDRIVFDRYIFPIELPELSKLVGKDIKPSGIIPSSNKDDILLNSNICNKIKNGINMILNYLEICKKLIKT